MRVCGTAVRVIHNAYVDCGTGTSDVYDCSEPALANSSRALKALNEVLPELVGRHQITHILFMAMGWNNWQVDAAESFETITQQIDAAVDRPAESFRPLVIGLTWHSGWKLGGINIPGVSYNTKADDADEIGMTWANNLLDQILIPLSHQEKAPLVAIGHSFGARLLARAAASGHFVHSPSEEPLHLLVLLQGAFAIDRFLPERRQGREGAPYLHLHQHVGRVVMTWSEKDKAVPWANLFSGAKFAGGPLAYQRASAYKARFSFQEWDSFKKQLQALGPQRGIQGEECATWPISSESTPVDVIKVPAIKRHGDIKNPEVGAFLWHLIRSIPSANTNSSS